MNAVRAANCSALHLGQLLDAEPGASSSGRSSLPGGGWPGCRRAKASAAKAQKLVNVICAASAARIVASSSSVHPE
ncbi:hypothetical protein ACIA5D_46135 [Actinoplanes sp. NPDC051513]|uniref:hypothetical protein n=1 Tax=Actinoplanes sp. NPDC051513 TaxID=3363908 RepID=UPI0037A5A25F